jgi:hypothetical protein
MKPLSPISRIRSVAPMNWYILTENQSWRDKGMGRSPIELNASDGVFREHRI